MLIIGIHNRVGVGWQAAVTNLEKRLLSLCRLVGNLKRGVNSLPVPPKHESPEHTASSPCGAREDYLGQDSSGVLRTTLCTEQLRTW